MKSSASDVLHVLERHKTHFHGRMVVWIRKKEKRTRG